MQPVDVAIIGSGARGLWLSAELAKLGWSVIWVQARTPETNLGKDGFEYDDMPWQVGSSQTNTKLSMLAGKYITKVIDPVAQEVAVQIVTKNGPLELSGGLGKYSLEKFFPENFEELEKYIECVGKAKELTPKKSAQLISAYTKKAFENPLSKRWVLDWIGSLRRSRLVTSRDWVLKWNGEILDPKAPFWILKDDLSHVVERGIAWAEKQGVVIHRNARIADIDVIGRLATGIAFDRAEGFTPVKRIIFSCSYQTIENKFSKFASVIKDPLKTDASALVWIRCGFLLKPGSKPAGLCDFSSFVIDPLMPLVNENAGLFRWKSGVKTDSLTVWVRVNLDEVKRRSFLEELQKNIQSQVTKQFPWFLKQLISSLPFEEHLLTQDLSHDDLAFAFSAKNTFKSQTTRLKNVYLAGPEFDEGLEFLSQLATEMKLLEKLAAIRLKELPRDRTIHTPRNGQSLGQSKQV
jgi:hypothetical protein